MKVLFKKFFLIFSVTIASYIVVGLLVPDILKLNVSPIRFSDSSAFYIGAANMISNISNGGISLWNFYDQMPLAYHFLGILFNCSLVNVIIASFYFISRLFISPQFLGFHNIFSIAYINSALFIQTAGVYLLVRKFSRSMVITVFVLLLTNIILSPHLFFGMGTGPFHIYIPFLIYFILEFFEKFEIKALAKLVLMLVIAVYTCPLGALQYPYHAIHFVILACVMVYFKELAYLARQITKGEINIYKSLKNNIGGCLVIVVLSIIILAPFAILLVNNHSDYYIGPEKTRFVNMLSIGEYFRREVFFAAQDEFFPNMVDFTKSESWARSWFFIGFISVFLAITGALSSRDKRKYIPLFTILFFFLINSPRDKFSISGMAHWINALTNPFKFTVRSFHMVGAPNMAYLMIPLIAMGLESLYSFAADKRKMQNKDVLKIVSGLILFILLAVRPHFSFRHLKFEISQGLLFYLVLNILLATTFLLFLRYLDFRRFKNQALVFFIISVWCAGEMRAIKTYMQPIIKQMLVVPQQLFANGAPVILDYQEPTIYPFRYHYNNKPVPKISGYWETEHMNMFGLFSRYTNLEKYFHEANRWYPVHKSYRALSEDPLLQRYVRNDTRLFFWAGHAVPAEREIFETIMSKNLDRDVVMVHDCDKKILEDAEAIIDKLNTSTQIMPDPNFKYMDISLENSGHIQIDHTYMVKLYSVNLPSDFPKEMSSTIYTDDKRYFHLFERDRELTQTQARPIAPYTYDIQNYSPGRLTVALPMDLKGPFYPAFRFYYPVGDINGVGKILKYKQDILEFTYTAPGNGWLVFHYPFDKKWRVKIDEKEVDFYRINYCFMGFKINRGMHKINIQYWPSVFVRILFLPSVFFATFGAIYLIFSELRVGQIYNRFYYNLARLLFTPAFQKRRILGIWDFKALPWSVGDPLTFVEMLSILKIRHEAEAVDVSIIYDRDNPIGIRTGVNNLTPENVQDYMLEFLPLFSTSPYLGSIYQFSSRKEFYRFLKTNYRRYYIFPPLKQHLGETYNYDRGAAPDMVKIQEFYNTYGHIPYLRIGDRDRFWARWFYLNYLPPGTVPVAVSLKQTSHTPERNADPQVWLSFIDRCRFDFPEVVFIIVGLREEIFEGLRNRPNVVIAKDFGTSLIEDLALINASLMYMCTTSGISTIAVFSSLPYLIFQFPEEQLADHRLGPGGSWAFATENQKIFSTATIVTPELLLDEFNKLYANLDRGKWRIKVSEGAADKYGHPTACVVDSSPSPSLRSGSGSE